MHAKEKRGLVVVNCGHRMHEILYVLWRWWQTDILLLV